MDHILSDLSTMTHPSWVAPRAWLSFIELDKALVLVWLDWLVFCDYGFSESAFWCPLAKPTLLRTILYGMDLTEAEDIKKRWQEYTEELYKKDLHDPGNHDGVITHLVPDILMWSQVGLRKHHYKQS